MTSVAPQNVEVEERVTADDGLALLLEELVITVRRYVVVTSAQAAAVSLWALHTHAFDAADTTPYLHVSSAERRSGKSLLFELLELLVAKPWKVVTPSEAVVFRKIAASTPTLLLDEVDAIYGPKAQNHEGLRAMLNAGFRIGTTVPRCVGDGSKMRVEDFPVFCPKALAGIGTLPDTIADRTIRLELKRKTPDESVDRFRRREVAAVLGPLREALTEWALEHADGLAVARPQLPEPLDDRAADVWEPLLAIADTAGSDWSTRARDAALELSGPVAREDQSMGVRLLADVHSAFDRREVDRLTSAELVEQLASDEESPWADWYGKPITQKKVAELLKPYGVHSRSIRLADGRNLKGYKRETFEDAWRRYAPVNGTRNVTTSQPAWEAGLRLFSNRHTDELVTVGNAPDPAWLERCDVVTAETPEEGLEWR